MFAIYRFLLFALIVARRLHVQLPASKSIAIKSFTRRLCSRQYLIALQFERLDDTIVMTSRLDGNSGHIDILAAGTAMFHQPSQLTQQLPGTRIIRYRYATHAATPSSAYW